jgi:hypothetical protein
LPVSRTNPAVPSNAPFPALPPRVFACPLYPSPRPRRGWVLAAAALGGCTTFQTFVTGSAGTGARRRRFGAERAVGPGGAASGLRPPGAPPVAAAPGALRPFAEVVKDAKRTDAAIAFWQKDDKVWLELRPEDLNQPFFLSSKLKTGIGERGFFGGLMQDSGIVEFRRVHNQMQMIWRNIGYIAKAGTPEAAAIEAGYSPSLIASAPVLSQPDPRGRRCWSRPTRSSSPTCSASAWTCSAAIARAMPSIRATRRSPRRAAAPTSSCSRSSATTPRRRSRCRSRARPGHAAALGAALAARPAQHVPRPALFAGAAARPSR